MAIRVGVVGAAGRMGAEVVRAVVAADDLHLVAAVDPRNVGRPALEGADGADDVHIEADLDALTAAGASVAVDFTRPEAVAANTLWLLDHGIHAVVGTTGWQQDDLRRVDAAAGAGDANAVVAPNFAVGAVLMMRMAQLAARHLPHVEIVELHHDGKADAPSGTSLRTADLIAEARGAAPEPTLGEVLAGARGADRAGVRVHAVRLPGLVAHQEVIFGGEGQRLSIRHDSVDRTSFMPGVLLAVREVARRPGLTIGIEELLDLPAV